jgi:hypothetical protein
MRFFNEQPLEPTGRGQLNNWIYLFADIGLLNDKLFDLLSEFSAITPYSDPVFQAG